MTTRCASGCSGLSSPGCSRSFAHRVDVSPRAHKSSPCPLGVKNGSRGLAARCLLCPGERTSSGCLGMSEKCPLSRHHQFIERPLRAKSRHCQVYAESHHVDDVELIGLNKLSDGSCRLDAALSQRLLESAATAWGRTASRHCRMTSSPARHQRD